METTGSIENRITYTGQMYDGVSGQYYLRARFYHPAIGRFLQEDTYRGDGLNLYAYCKGNPVVYCDPSGFVQLLCEMNKTNPGKENKKVEVGSTKKKSLPDWLKERFDAGNQFNKDNRSNYPYNEVEVSGEKKNYVVDSYKPNEEIVSRKHTQLSKVQESTGIRYINELEFKYSPGSTITDSQFNPNVLKGGTLQGDMILEIPVQTSPIPPNIIDAAMRKGITIKDITGKVYK